jgi:hypothetical protein
MKKLLVIILCVLGTLCGCNKNVASDVFERDIVSVDINTVETGKTDDVEFKASVNIGDEVYSSAVLSIDEENTISLTDRHTYTLKLNDKSYKLNNCYGDPSYMRDYISRAALAQNGVLVPKCTYADLSIDGDNKGLYILEENVDEDFVKNNLGEGGNLYKPAKGCTMRTDTTDYSAYTLVCGQDENFNNLKILSDKTGKLTDGKKGDEESFLDVDTFLNCMAFDYVFGSYDSINGSGNNYYIYEKDGRFTMIPCNMSGAMGGYEDEDIANLDEPYNGEDVSFPLVTKLLSIEEYKQKYYGYVENYVEWAEINIPEMVEKQSAVIDIYAKNAESAFYTYDEYRNAIALYEEPADETQTEETTQATTVATTVESTSEQTTEAETETTTVKSRELKIGTYVVSDSYTSSQAIGMRVTSPADKKKNTAEKTKTETAQTEQTQTKSDEKQLPTEASDTGRRITYSKIYEKQDFSIVTYMLERIQKIKDELLSVNGEDNSKTE